MENRFARVHIGGIVQGVGFRPFVYQLAVQHALKGWVRNTSSGVDIEIEGPAARLDAFLEDLKTPPPLARIDSFEASYGALKGFSGFEILTSVQEPGSFQPISPDVALCADCRKELFDPADRRFRYPFINCTHCGPRLTIIKDIPYDRPETTMAGFKLCPACEAEYKDPLDRRFHAQPVACADCGPQIWLDQLAGTRIFGEAALRAVRAALIEGKITAVKGLGGFHLACDAENVKAVETLRQRKLRVEKPFALMMADLEVVRRHCFLPDGAEELLSSREAPIVLLEKRPESSIAEAVAPGQIKLGVMLPYTPLHFLLLEKAEGFPTVLVMTSANLSEEPIVYRNEDVIPRLKQLADVFLLHNREIHTRCDDSVSTLFEGLPYITRRSRGYAPDPVKLAAKVPPMLAAGAELKNTFCLTRDHYAFVSHHIGDMENYETLTAYEEAVSLYQRLFRIKPEIIVSDLHPDYMATRYALQRAEQEGLPLIQVQHHFAHIVSCMAEHQLPVDESVIGVSFDGTGYGLDGAVWGGEFLLADQAGFQRAFSLRYVPLAGGDAAVRNPWRMALAWLQAAGVSWAEDLPPVRAASKETLTLLEQQLALKLNAPKTSSMGRLFDAAASLIGVRQQINYEAQAAMELEALVDPAEFGRYSFEFDGQQINAGPMFVNIVSDLRHGTAPAQMAARFHNTVAAMVLEGCSRLREKTSLNRVVLSGGVWQNLTLLENAMRLLEGAQFEILIQRKVPANDGGLSLGQAAAAAQQAAGRQSQWVEE
ncbi:MAG: carbamoyltransferase HypF [Anaerolineales bacterium]|nr:carbamoyltransferase HypF [Anaerolineales bacterium]